MKLRLLTIGQKMPAWVNDAYADYSKRIQPMLPVELVELPMTKRASKRGAKNPSAKEIQQYCHAEGERILTAKRPNERLICLDVKGKALSTEKLANKLQDWMQDGMDISLAVGGPDGLSPEVLQAADWTWSLSPLTLPHPLVRVILIEQLYRAMSINHNHPYHRA